MTEKKSFAFSKENTFGKGLKYMPVHFFPVGHGRSEGERAQVSDFSDYIRDLFKHIDQVTAEYTEIPIFMFGHSMVSASAVFKC